MGVAVQGMSVLVERGELLETDVGVTAITFELAQTGRRCGAPWTGDPQTSARSAGRRTVGLGGRVARRTPCDPE